MYPLGGSRLAVQGALFLQAVITHGKDQNDTLHHHLGVGIEVDQYQSVIEYACDHAGHLAHTAVDTVVRDAKNVIKGILVFP